MYIKILEQCFWKNRKSNLNTQTHTQSKESRTSQSQKVKTAALYPQAWDERTTILRIKQSVLKSLKME